MRFPCGQMAVIVVSSLLSGCLPFLMGALGPGGGVGSTPAVVGMPSGSGIQNSLPTDRSVGDALTMSEQDVTEACRARVAAEAERDAEKPTDKATKKAAGACGIRPVCMPGALAPVHLYICPRPHFEHGPPASAPAPKRMKHWDWTAAVTEPESSE